MGGELADCVTRSPNAKASRGSNAYDGPCLNEKAAGGRNVFRVSTIRPVDLNQTDSRACLALNEFEDLMFGVARPE